MRKLVLIIFILLNSVLFGAYGLYKTQKIKSGKAYNIPGRPENEEWNYIELYGKDKKAFLKIFTKLDMKKYTADFYTYIKNLTNTTVRFYLVIQLRYIFKRGYKIVLGAGGKLGPKKRVIQLGANFSIIDWGVAVYKKWKDEKSFQGRGVVEHW